MMTFFFSLVVSLTMQTPAATGRCETYAPRLDGGADGEGHVVRVEYVGVR